MSHHTNLNEIQADNDGNYPSVSFLNNSISSGKVSVYFRNIQGELEKFIDESSIIVGCVAWLTEPNIISSLSRRNSSIVVQKEDFLRPDLNSGTNSNWSEYLRGMYNKLNCSLSRYEFKNSVLSSVSVCSDDSMHAIRCMGNHNSSRMPAFPRMHNKFLVDCSYVDDPNDDYGMIVPKRVWTGSFNMTKNAGNSLENVLVISDFQIALAY